MTRTLRWLLGTLVVVALVWSAAWFGASWYIERTFDEQTARLREGGTDISCAERSVSGYPFTLAFSCDRVRAEAGAAEAAVAGLVTDISLSRPQTIRVEPDGPARLASPRLAAARGGAGALEFGWADMRVEVDDVFSPDRRIEAWFEDLAVKGPFGAASVAAGSVLLAPHSASSEALDDLSIVATQRQVSLQPIEASGLPRLDLARTRAEIVLDGAYEALVRRGEKPEAFFKRGFTGRIGRLSVATGGDGLLLLSGPFSVDARGRVSGRLTIGVRGPGDVTALVEQLVGKDAEVGLVIAALEGLGQPREVDGEQVKALDVTIADGTIPVGFFSFDLPPLWRE